jgi:hypothetical protein
VRTRLKSITPAAGKAPKALAHLGVLAGPFLVLYGASSGSKEEIHQRHRRHGIKFYFGVTYLRMPLTGTCAFHLAQGGSIGVPWHLHHRLGVLCPLVLVFVLTNSCCEAMSRLLTASKTASSGFPARCLPGSSRRYHRCGIERAFTRAQVPKPDSPESPISTALEQARFDRLTLYLSDALVGRYDALCSNRVGRNARGSADGDRIDRIGNTD